MKLSYGYQLLFIFTVSIFSVVMPSPVTLVNATAHPARITEVIVCRENSNESPGGAGKKGRSTGPAGYTITFANYRSCKNMLSDPIVIAAGGSHQINGVGSSGSSGERVMAINGEVQVPNTSGVKIAARGELTDSRSFYIMGPANAKSYSVHRFIQ